MKPIGSDSETRDEFCAPSSYQEQSPRLEDDFAAEAERLDLRMAVAAYHRGLLHSRVAAVIARWVFYVHCLVAGAAVVVFVNAGVRVGGRPLRWWLGTPTSQWCVALWGYSGLFFPVLVTAAASARYKGWRLAVVALASVVLSILQWLALSLL